MNAIICEKYEARVLTSETIEVHLQYLRSGLDGVQAALPVLRDKIDLLSAMVDAKIEKTNARIEAVSTSLGEKIEKTNTRIEAVNTSLDAKLGAIHTDMAAVRDSIANLRAMLKAILWMLSGLGALIPIGFTIAKALHWI
jgi:peptidoglycan hydrolase CwlO-like protein